MECQVGRTHKTLDYSAVSMLMYTPCRDGRFLNSLRGHVAPVYQCAFSADSRLLVSCSKDTTLKGNLSSTFYVWYQLTGCIVWNMQTFKLAVDLPGHEDEVWAVVRTSQFSLLTSGAQEALVRSAHEIFGKLLSCANSDCRRIGVPLIHG